MSTKGEELRYDSPNYIVRFYEPSSPVHEPIGDARGRTLDQILRMNDTALEMRHDYIQVIFPLPEMSPVNPEAPLITADVRTAFLNRPELRERMREAFIRMAQFYGFGVDGSVEEPMMTATTDFEHRAEDTWLTWSDHNHLRITRIIRCLRVLGLEPLAVAFHKALVDHSQGVVSDRSMMYWERAATRPLHLPPSENNVNARGIAWLKDA